MVRFQVELKIKSISSCRVLNYKLKKFGASKQQFDAPTYEIVKN